MRVLETLAEHGYLVLFLLVVAERVGLPLPAVPILVATGALIRRGTLGGAPAVAVAVGACLLADLIWYEAGRRRGAQVMRSLCRVSLEPDSCVRRTEELFARWGVRSLLFAKFVPPIGVITVPMSGMMRVGATRFLLIDAAGSLVWVLSFLSLGYGFAEELERLLERLAFLGIWLLAVLLAPLAIYLSWKYWRRRRLLRDLNVARISVDELRRKLDAGEPVAIVDLRHAIEVQADPRTLPGALHIPLEEFAQRHHEVPRDRDVILFCT